MQQPTLLVTQLLVSYRKVRNLHPSNFKIVFSPKKQFELPVLSPHECQSFSAFQDSATKSWIISPSTKIRQAPSPLTHPCYFTSLSVSLEDPSSLPILTITYTPKFPVSSDPSSSTPTTISSANATPTLFEAEKHIQWLDKLRTSRITNFTLTQTWEGSTFILLQDGITQYALISTDSLKCDESPQGTDPDQLLQQAAWVFGMHSSHSFTLRPFLEYGGLRYTNYLRRYLSLDCVWALQQIATLSPGETTNPQTQAAQGEPTTATAVSNIRTVLSRVCDFLGAIVSTQISPLSGQLEVSSPADYQTAKSFVQKYNELVTVLQADVPDWTHVRLLLQYGWIDALERLQAEHYQCLMRLMDDVGQDDPAGLARLSDLRCFAFELNPKGIFAKLAESLISPKPDETPIIRKNRYYEVRTQGLFIQVKNCARQNLGEIRLTLPEGFECCR